MIPVPEITKLIRTLRQRQKFAWTFAALSGTLGLISGFLYLILSSESIYWFSPSIKHKLLNLAQDGSVFLLLIFLIFVLILFARSKYPSNIKLSKLIARQNPDVRDKLLNALQLAQSDEKDGSSELKKLAVTEMEEIAKNLNAADYINNTWVKKSSYFVLAVFLLILVTGIPGFKSMQSAFIRLQNPDKVYVKPGTITLSLLEKDTLDVIQGQELILAVKSLHYKPDYIEFVIDQGTGNQKVLPAKLDNRENSEELYTAHYDHIERNFEFFARSGKSVSDTTFVNVIPRPRISRLDITVISPEYSNLAPLHLPEGVGDVHALPGSRIKIELESSRPLQKSTLYFQGDRSKKIAREMSVQERRATSSLKLQSEGKWWIEMLAEDGTPSSDALEWKIRLMPDLYPQVEVYLPENESNLPKDKILPFAAVADDDYGISKMNLRFLIYDAMMMPDSLPEDVFSTIELNPDSLSPGRVGVQTFWSLRELPILPLDEVLYFVEAWDNDNVSGPKRSKSELRRIIYSTVEDLFAEIEQEEEMLGQDLNQTIDQAKQLKEQMEESITKLRSNPDDLSWEDQRSIEKVVEMQEELFKQLEEATKSIEELKEQFNQQQMVSPELMEKYSKLQELVDELATPEMRAAMEELREALETQDGDMIREALENLQTNQEEFIENLDRSISILEQLNNERRMEELTQRAEDLAQRQQEIVNQLENADENKSERLAAEQELLSKELENLLADMKETAEQISETNPEISEAMKELSQQTEESNLSEQMQNAASDMQSGKQKQAQQKGQKISDQLQQMVMSLQQMQQQMVDQNKNQLSELMDRIIERILVVSQLQENVRETSETLGVSSPRFRKLAASQLALTDALAVVMQDARDLSRETFFVGAPLLAELENADLYMERAIKKYTDRFPRQVTSEQQKAMASLHRAILSLEEAQNQMQQSSSGTGYQEMMEQLSQMAQQQQSLNQQSQGMPMPIPGQQGQMPGGQMMSELAAQQRAMAEAMRQLEDQAQSMKDILGSLEGMGDAMEEVAKDMENQNITDRTRKQQERILQRLLDSQRSLQQREMSRERMSQTGRDFRRMSPDQLSPEHESYLREKLERAMRNDFSRSWQQIIRDYYRALEKSDLQPVEREEE